MDFGNEARVNAELDVTNSAIELVVQERTTLSLGLSLHAARHIQHELNRQLHHVARELARHDNAAKPQNGYIHPGLHQPGRGVTALTTGTR